jgi:PEP-CTERM motif
MALRSGFSPPLVAGCAVLAVMLALFAPVAARATSCQSNNLETCVSNTDGTPSSSGSGASTTISLSSSEVTGIGWKSNGTTLGHLNFTTGDLSSGSLGMGGTFSGTNSTFTITGSYNNVHNGTIFKGSFDTSPQPIQWMLINPTCATSGASCEYDLTANLKGIWYPNGTTQNVSGVTVQLYFKTTGGLYTGKAGTLTDIGGFSNLDTPLVTPEPGTLALMGTGFVGIGLVARRKYKARSTVRRETRRVARRSLDNVPMVEGTTA